MLRPMKLGMPRLPSVDTSTQRAARVLRVAAFRRGRRRRHPQPEAVDRVLGDPAEHRGGDQPAVRRRARAIDHHQNREARGVGREESDERRHAGAGGVAAGLAVDLLRRAGLARQPEYHRSAPACPVPPSTTPRSMSATIAAVSAEIGSSDDLRLVFAEHGSVGRDDTTHNVRPHELAPVGDGGIGTQQLERGDGDALPEAGGDQIDARPLVRGTHESGTSPGKSTCVECAEAKGLNRRAQPGGPEAFTDLGSADVARMLDDVRKASTSRRAHDHERRVCRPRSCRSRRRCGLRGAPHLLRWRRQPRSPLNVEPGS